MKIPPKFAFVFGACLVVANIIATGTIHLSGLVPPEAVPMITGWASVFVTVGLALQTYMAGASSASSGPLAPAPTTAEADAIKAQALRALTKDK